MPRPAVRLAFLSAVALISSAPALLAGGAGENVYLIVDPTNAESLYVANYYKQKRGIPDVNVLYMAPGAANYQSFTDANLPGFLGSLANKDIEDHVDFVVVPSGGNFYLPASGYVNDGCFPVNRFTPTTGYTLAYRADDILNGINSLSANRYAKNSWEPHYFDSNLKWLNGDPSNDSAARQYFIGAMLGYTGTRGNTLAEVLAMIDRSVAADGSHPAGTFYFMETTDVARSGPRDGAYPTAVSEIIGAGGAAQHILDWLPLGHHDCLGIMTGLASWDIDNANLTLLPGSFADHLTSYAATFDDGSQTKMSRWIAKGASGTAGTVEEPCNYSGKFPHARLHVVYYKGLTLGESWYRSLGFEPFQNLFIGDPLTQPFAWPPLIDLLDAPDQPVSGTITLTPLAVATAPGAQIDHVELYVDGVLRTSAGAGGLLELDTRVLADGWHELRVSAFDDSLVRNTANYVGELVTDNDGLSVGITPALTTGDLATRFDFDVAATGATPNEILLLCNDRVLASTTQANATLAVHGQIVGAGQPRIQAEARFSDGSRARSAPVELSVAYTGAGAGTAPVAHGFTKKVLFDSAFVLELPATFDDPLGTASYSVVTPPSQSTILNTGNGPWRVLRPSPTASGTDSLVFRVTTPAGTSADATITLVYACAPVRYCPLSSNSVGSGARMEYSGTTSIEANDLSLYVSGLPVNQFGLYYYGKTAIQVPFGNGFRCIGGAIARFPLQQSDAFGYAYQTIDNQHPPSNSLPFLVDGTLCFQYWYRDPQGGGSAFNLSDALSITFCP